MTDLLPHQKLAAALLQAGLTEMSLAAAGCRYHDFRSSLDDPATQLVTDLKAAYAKARDGDQARAILAILEAHLSGAWDATPAESEAWMESSEGRDAMVRLVEGR